MSWTLFKANIKTNRVIWIIMTVIFVFYFAIMVSMFDPAGAEAMEDMLSMMPEAMVKALGMDTMGTTLLTFLNGYMYGFLVLLFPMVISIVVNHRLMASHVDKGSMAYLLATPNSRIRIARTQALFSVASATAFFFVATILGILISQSMFPGELEVGKFILVNFYALLMYFAIGGIGFFASSIADESKTSLGLGMGLPIAFLVLQMLGGVGEDFSWVGNLSMYALFDPNKLVAGESFAWLGMAAFVVIALTLYTAGIVIFNKRDLHV
ncbi:MAG: ABC transporter permease [Firmicutes bacterium]|nr:ABC transporter permease [Bacillota bacterium]